jgi:hypothetical protein
VLLHTKIFSDADARSRIFRGQKLLEDMFFDRFKNLLKTANWCHIFDSFSVRLKVPNFMSLVFLVN